MKSSLIAYPEQSSSETSSTKEILFRKLLVGICSFSVVLVLGYSFRYSSILTHGFAGYYGFSKLLVEGEHIDKAYDNQYFHSKLAGYGFGRVRDIVNNLPTNALVFAPFTPFSPPVAKIIWTLLSLIFYGLSLRILLSVNDIQWNDNLGLAIISLACLWRPSYENIAYGQLYFLLLILFSLSLRGIVQNKLFTQSVPIAAAFLVKGYGLICAVWFFFHRRPKSAFVVLLTVVVLVLSTLHILDEDTWITYYETVVVNFGLLPASGHVAYQTLNSLFLHLLSYDPRWFPSPIVILPSETLRLIVYATSVSLAFCVLMFQRSGTQAKVLISFSAILGVSVVTAPQATEYHYILFLPLTISILRQLFPKGNTPINLGFFEIPVIIAIITLAVPIKYKWLNDADFPWYLFAYPKLYAGLVLIGYSFLIPQTFHDKQYAYYIRQKNSKTSSTSNLHKL